jgi:mycofactocin precursor
VLPGFPRHSWQAIALTKHIEERIQTMKDQEKEARIGNCEELSNEPVDILEEVEVEDLTVDGICGVY